MKKTISKNKIKEIIIETILIMSKKNNIKCVDIENVTSLIAEDLELDSNEDNLSYDFVEQTSISSMLEFIYYEDILDRYFEKESESVQEEHYKELLKAEDELDRTCNYNSEKNKGE